MFIGRRILLILLAGALGVSAPQRAFAMPPIVDRPAKVALLAPTSSTSIILKSVHTKLRCTSASSNRCEFTSTYVFSNATAADELVDVIAVGHRIAGVELTVDGTRRTGRDTEVEAKSTREFPALTGSRRSFEFVVPAGSDAEVTVTGAMRPREPEDHAPVRVSLPVRHPLLGQDPGPTRLHFVFDLTPFSDWSGTARPSFAVEVPAHWSLRMSPDAETVDPVRHTEYSIRASIEPRGLMHGGPYVALGGLVDEPHGLLGRIGYEAGHGLWTVFGLALDTDFESQMVLSPTIHAASAGWSCIFPSFGLGLGPALQLGSRTAVGSRVLAEIQLPYIGVVGNLDWYPVLDSPNLVDIAILGRLSL